jgi:multiple sugar transport system permease protein
MAAAKAGSKEMMRGESLSYPDWFKPRRPKAHMLLASWTVPLAGLLALVLLALVLVLGVVLTFAVATGNGASPFAGVMDLVSQGRFGTSLWNVAAFLIFGPVLQVAAATAIAVTLYGCIRSGLVRSLVLLLIVSPLMVSSAAAGLLWQYLLDPSTSALSATLLEVGAIDRPLYVPGAESALALAIVADGWNKTALPILIIYFGRASLPQSLYQAARIDGASRWQGFRDITLPLLRDVIVAALLLRMLDALRSPDLAMAFGGGGGRAGFDLPASLILDFAIYERRPAAAAVLALLMLAASTALFLLLHSHLRRCITLRSGAA